MAEQRDFYSILQVNRNATQDQIERAYQRLAKVYDPAVSRKPRAAARLKEIEEAYAVLNDRKARADYDRGHQRRAGSILPVDTAVGGFLSRNYMWVAAGGVTGAIVIALVLIVTLGSGGSSATTPSPTAVTSPTATPEGQTPGPSGAPATPPPVTGNEQTTDSGLKFVEVQEGAGESPKVGDIVTVNYTGWLQSDGTKFDSSLDRGTPFTFTIGTGAVIQGWDEGVASMKPGGTRRLIIPPELGYGSTANQSIPANSTLIFDVELISFESPQPATP